MCGNATRSWAPAYWNNHLAPLHDRRLWRKAPFAHEEKGFGVHWITEVMAIMCSDISAELRMNRIKSVIFNIVKQGSSLGGDFSTGLCSIAEAWNMAKHIMTKEHEVGVILIIPLAASLVSTSLLYTDAIIDIMDAGSERQDIFTPMLPVMASDKAGIFPLKVTFDKDKAGKSVMLLNTLTILENFMNIAYECRLGLTNITTDNLIGMIRSDYATIGSAGYFAWPLFLLVIAAAEGAGPVKRTPSECVDLCRRLTVYAFALAQDISYEFYSRLPETRSVAEIREDILKNRKYMLWDGITDIEWKEGLLEGLTTYYDGLDNLIYSSLLGKCDLSVCDKKLPDDMSVQYFLSVPGIDDEEGWAEIQQDYIESARDPESDMHLNEYGITAEAMRMCLVRRDSKILKGSGRAPMGSVRGTRDPKKTEVSVIYIPRRHYSKDTHTTAEGYDRPVSGTEEKSNHKSPILHMVAGFLRQMPSGQKASERACVQASLEGFSYLPEGYTFVKTHTRGKARPDERHRVRVKKGRKEKND